MILQITKYVTVTAILLGTSNAFADSTSVYNLSMDEAITKGLQANVNLAIAGARLMKLLVALSGDNPPTSPMYESRHRLPIRPAT